MIPATSWYDRLHVLGIATCIAAFVIGGIFHLVIERPLIDSLDKEASAIRADGDPQGLLPARHYFPAGMAWIARQVVIFSVLCVGLILTGVGTIGFRRSRGTKKTLHDAAWITVVISIVLAAFGVIAL